MVKAEDTREQDVGGMLDQAIEHHKSSIENSRFGCAKPKSAASEEKAKKAGGRENKGSLKNDEQSRQLIENTGRDLENVVRLGANELRTKCDFDATKRRAGPAFVSAVSICVSQASLLRPS